jgi:hypothetical protein
VAGDGRGHDAGVPGGRGAPGGMPAARGRGGGGAVGASRVAVHHDVRGPGGVAVRGHDRHEDGGAAAHDLAVSPGHRRAGGG